MAGRWFDMSPVDSLERKCIRSVTEDSICDKYQCKYSRVDVQPDRVLDGQHDTIASK
jgi:hypothetical protein